jgi:hypothetical protein
MCGIEGRLEKKEGRVSKKNPDQGRNARLQWTYVTTECCNRKKIGVVDERERRPTRERVLCL